MSDNSNGFFGRIFGSRSQNEAYQPVSANQSSTNGTPSNPNHMPGYFPLEDTEEQGSLGRVRNYFNSVMVSHSVRSVGGWINYIFIKPIIIVLVIFFRIIAQLLNVIYFREKHGTRSRSFSNTTASSTLINDPIDRVNHFVRVLEDNLTPQQQYGQSHMPVSVSSLPPFFEGSYTQALYMSHQRAKFLFVYLTHPQNENSSIIFNKIITNPEFISLFNDPNIIIWGGDLTNLETYQLANSLNVTKFPFLGLLCLTRTSTMSPQGPVKTSPKISLVLKIQGSFPEDQNPSVIIQNKFKKRISKYEDELSLIRSELRDKYMSQVILRQQDLNYQKSLAEDRLKKQKKQYEKVKKQYLIWKTKDFENWRSDPVAGSARVAIKLQNGNRVTFHFPPEASVREIFTYVELLNGGYLDGNISGNVTDSDVQKYNLNFFKITYKFKLLSPLPPKRNLNDLLVTETKVKDIDCIYPNGLLIVEDL